MLFIGLMAMGAFEWVREAGRKPYLIYDHIYSNSILKAEYDAVDAEGILKKARWVKNRDITDENRIAAGKEIYRLECLSCHAINGPMNDILPLTEHYTVFGMDGFLGGIGKLKGYMPRFAGTKEERRALAAYIITGLHNKKEAPASIHAKELNPDIPAFDGDESEYVLLAWNSIGVHMLTDSSKYWTLFVPGNRLDAQLIRRGELPEFADESIEITYRVEKGFENPSAQVAFWNFSSVLTGKSLKKNTGITGNGLAGRMMFNEEMNLFSVKGVPAVPYTDERSFNPYPVFAIEAREKDSGRVLTRTKMAVPVSTEMGCRNCHGGAWRVGDAAGLTPETSMDVLRVHDKNSHTDLLGLAEKGNPQACQDCHSDSFTGSKGKPELLNMSASIHGWHAVYLSQKGAEACHQCHPSSQHGATRFFRGRHAGQFDCTDCHGFLEDHALSLLKAEDQAGKKGAERLIKHLASRRVDDKAKINHRKPWVNEPDCLSCHVDFQSPDLEALHGFNEWTAAAGELYRFRRDEMDAVMCAACHGSPHAVYPAVNIVGRDRDNLQPLQYQGNRETIGAQNCSACHVIEMEEEGHHENQL